jgi:hypothetical protein
MSDMKRREFITLISGTAVGGVGVRTGLVAASVSTSLLPKLASCHPPLDSAGVPVGDGLRPIDAQF